MAVQQVVVRDFRNSTALEKFSTQLAKPPFEEPPFRFLLGKRQCLFVGKSSLSGPAKPAAHLRPSGMREVVLYQIAASEQRVDEGQPRLWAVAHGNSHGAVQLDHGRGFGSGQHAIQRHDLRPIRQRGGG